MTTKIIFNIDKKLKEAAMKKAQKQGLSLSAVLNLATQAFVSNSLQIGMFESHISEARGEAKQGTVVSQEKLFRRLDI